MRKFYCKFDTRILIKDNTWTKTFSVFDGKSIENSSIKLIRYNYSMQYRLTLKSYLLVSIILIPIIAYFIIVIKSSVNFPFEDDYRAILDFLISYNDSTTFSTKIELLVSQHNEHRIIFGRLITLLYYKLFHPINFIHLIIIGNLSLIGILWILFKSIKITSLNNRLILLIPVSIFLFNFRYSEVSIWAMASLQNIWVLLFAFLSLYFLFNEKKQSILAAILFATLATFTSGNGLLAFLTGIIMLILRKDNKKTIALFAFAFLINIIGFVIGIHKVGHHPSFIDSFISEPTNLFLYPLNFIGSLFYISSNWLRYFIGGLVLVTFIFIFIKKFYEINYLAVSLLLFMILTVGIVSVSRFGFGVQQAGVSRYMINSTLIYILIGLISYELCVKYLPNAYSKAFVLLSFTLSIIFSGNGYRYNWYRISYAQQQRHTLSLINSGIYSKIDYHYPDDNETLAERTLEKANKFGIYQIELTNIASTKNK